VRVFFLPLDAAWLAWSGDVTLKGIEPDVRYRGFYFNAKTGKEHDLGTVTPDPSDDFLVPKPPILQDWVFVLEGER